MVYWTEQDFKEIYGRYQESGLSIREFCNREGILEGRFHHWKKRPGKENGSHQFVPMKLNRHTGGLEVAPQAERSRSTLTSPTIYTTIYTTNSENTPRKC